jgi:hypothetical protein
MFQKIAPFRVTGARRARSRLRTPQRQSDQRWLRRRSVLRRSLTAPAVAPSATVHYRFVIGPQRGPRLRFSLGRVPPAKTLCVSGSERLRLAITSLRRFAF